MWKLRWLGLSGDRNNGTPRVRGMTSLSAEKVPLLWVWRTWVGAWSGYHETSQKIALCSSNKRVKNCGGLGNRWVSVI